VPRAEDEAGQDRSEHWRRVNALLGPALKFPSEEVDEYLRGACAGDEDLRLEVLSLVKADQAAGDFMEVAVEGGALDLVAARGLEVDRDHPEARLGQRIGSYRLDRTLGSGGMSTVFLGVRADDRFEKQVAVKVLKRGMDTDEVLHRFRQERQILASLDHPNIARLLDASSTDDGLPAFVLEHVEGLPVATYCDRHRFGVRERIELFRTICVAVQYAHQNLVVHRDLKPSNVLVTEEGVVKLLDFGIAKILAPERSSQDAKADPGTLHSTRAMTPSYASPEQVRGETITTASDVYTLGVLLYELLTGANPQRFLGGEPAEIERVVCLQEPVLPSASVVQGKAEQPPVVEVVEGGGRKLRRKLAGDLDTILLKALVKEPQRRYASADQLAEDLRRYLFGLPVLAQRDTAAYRMSKFVRRHRVAALLAIVLSATVLGSAITAVYQARVAIRAQVRAELERDRAETVLAFINGLFEVTDPSQQGSTVSAGALLDRGVELIPQSFADQPATQATLLASIGTIFRNWGHYDRAVPLLEESATLFASKVVADPVQHLASVNELGFALYESGNYDRASSVYRQALAVEEEEGLEALELARVDSINGLGLVLDAQGEGNAAEELYREALNLPAVRNGQPEGSLSEAKIQNGLATVLYRRADFAAAAPLLRRALEIRRRLQGDGHQETAQALHNLATVLVAWGRWEEAEKVLQEALALRRSLLGEEHPEFVRTLNTLATMRFFLGDLAGAEGLYRELIETRRRGVGQEHPEFAGGLNNLAKVIAAQGRWAEAEPLYRQALALKIRLQGEDHPAVPVTLHGLGEVLYASGRRDEAETLLRRALTLRRGTLKAGEPKIAETLVSLGTLLTDKGSFEEAEGLLLEAVALLEAKGPAEAKRLAQARTALEACRKASRDGRG